MKHVRRKLLKRKTKKTKPITESLNTYQGLNTPQQLPPHILDQIPSGASLRPSLASMRQIAAQKMATPFLPLPFNLTPQQQQVQNMRNNNDLKENAINQAKQDMINENERKRSLQKQEVDAKRENQILKQSLENEKQQFDQQQKLLDEKHKLDRQQKDLAFQKALMEGDKAIREQRLKNEEQLALVEQAKYENQKLKDQIESNELNTKFDQYKKQFEDITAENAALLRTINNFNTEDFANEYTELIQNISTAKAHSRLLSKLRETQDKIIEDKILNMFEPTKEQIRAQYEQMKTDIEGEQAALVEQIKLKQSKQEEIDKLENLRKYKQRIQLTADDLANETIELTKLKEGIGDIDDEVKTLIAGKVKAEVERDIEREKVDAKKKEEEAMLQRYLEEERQKLMNTDEYKKQISAIAGLKAKNQEFQISSRNWSEALDTYEKARRAQLDNEAQNVALKARIDGADPVATLESQFPSMTLSPSKASALHTQIAAQTTLASQESNEAADIIRRMQDLAASGGPKGVLFREFMEARETDIERLTEYLRNAPLTGVIDAWNDFEKGLPKDEQ